MAVNEEYPEGWTIQVLRIVADGDSAVSEVEVPHETPQPVALQPTEDAEAVYKQVLQEQLDKGSSPQVAEARAKVARVKAERGIKRGPTPIQTDAIPPAITGRPSAISRARRSSAGVLSGPLKTMRSYRLPMRCPG